MKKKEDLRFSLRNFILQGTLSDIGLGSNRTLVENHLGKVTFEDVPAVGGRHARYVDLNISFDYWIKNDDVFNINITRDTIMLKKNKTEGILKKMFDDYLLFYQPAKDILKLILENDIKLYYIETLSGELTNYYYVTSNNVKLFFNPFISEFYANAQLSELGADIGCLNQAKQHNAIEITKENFIVPPLFDELEKYPKGKKIEWKS